MKVFALTAAALSLSVVGAAADAIEDRQEVMKERRTLMQTLGPIAQGQQPFEAEAVLEALQRMNENAQAATDVATLWAPGTEGGDSAPRIWEEIDDYQALSDEFAAATAAAVEANPQDLDSFRAVFAPVAGSCGTCHEPYRL